METTTGALFEAWRTAWGQWRRTGDVSSLAEVAAAAEPPARLFLLDSIVPTGLRNEIVSLLRRKEAPEARWP